MAESNFKVPTSGCKAIAEVRGLFIHHYGDAGELPYAQLAASSDWKSVFTRRGSVNTNQDNPTLDKILVDQFDTPVAVTSEPGEFTIEALLPSWALDDLKDALNDESLGYESSDIDGLKAVGVELDGKMYDAGIMIKTSSGHYIMFPHVQFRLSFAQDDKLFALRLNGEVLAPTVEGNKTLYVACTKETTTSGGQENG